VGVEPVAIVEKRSDRDGHFFKNRPGTVLTSSPSAGNFFPRYRFRPDAFVVTELVSLDGVMEALGVEPGRKGVRSKDVAMRQVWT